jgi:hypothetical protein
MGFRKVPTIYTLEFKNPLYKGLEIRMKSISFGKVRKLISATEDASDENFEELLVSVENGIVSWNLEDENDQPVPANAEGLADQDFEFVMDVIMAWLDCMTGISDDLGKGSSSGPQFPGQPVTMEAL